MKNNVQGSNKLEKLLNKGKETSLRFSKSIKMLLYIVNIKSWYIMLAFILDTFNSGIPINIYVKMQWNRVQNFGLE